MVRGLDPFVALRRHPRGAALVLITAVVGAALLAVGSPADASNPATIAMGTTVNYSVLGASTVTNTGLSVLDGSVGLAPGSSITGFPPGVVTPPATVGPADDAAAQQAQVDLAAAYAAAASRPVDTIEPSELGSIGTLAPGVYGAAGDGALTLTGNLTLDGNMNPNAVFIFKTATTLTTASNSTVTLINGAQECNVFWQVGSSATLGTGTDFAGNVLAAASITATTGVIVHGRALAAGAAVTLDTNRFTQPTCDLSASTTTDPATTTTASATTTTDPATTTTLPAMTTTTDPATTTTLPATTTTTDPATTTTLPATTTTTDPATTTTASATTTLASTTTASSTTTDPSTRATGESPTSGRSGIRVAGPPQTGGGPDRKPHSPWPESVFFATLIIAGTIGVGMRVRVVTRRRPLS